MDAQEREVQIKELTERLNDLRKVKPSHGGHLIDFRMMEIEDELEKLRRRQ